jgi:hypothetical protein
VNDLTGRLTIDENRLLLNDLTPYLQLQQKLCLLIHSLRRARVVNKFVTLFRQEPKPNLQETAAAQATQNYTGASIILDPSL